MPIADFLIMAVFTAPQNILTDPAEMLYLLPLTAAIAIIYKTTKLPEITPANFIKETATLFGSIVVVIITIILALYAVAWLVNK
jgi:hypothetical protein